LLRSKASIPQCSVSPLASGPLIKFLQCKTLATCGLRRTGSITPRPASAFDVFQELRSCRRILLSIGSVLYISYCLLSIACCLLSIVCCPLSIGYCLLSMRLRVSGASGRSPTSAKPSASSSRRRAPSSAPGCLRPSAPATANRRGRCWLFVTGRNSLLPCFAASGRPDGDY
jgi:hypothetical protein